MNYRKAGLFEMKNCTAIFMFLSTCLLGQNVQNQTGGLTFRNNLNVFVKFHWEHAKKMANLKATPAKKISGKKSFWMLWKEIIGRRIQVRKQLFSKTGLLNTEQQHSNQCRLFYTLAKNESWIWQYWFKNRKNRTIRRYYR